MLETKQKKEILAQNFLFKGCSDSTLTDISKIAVELNLELGQEIYRPGEMADNVYVLVEGIVTFINKSGLEFLNVQGAIERSMIFGWAAMVPGQPNRIGTAQCLEHSKILSINGPQLLKILDEDIASGYSVMKTLCELITSTLEGKS